MPEQLKTKVEAQLPAEPKPAAGSSGWWQTLPGLLTAGAGILTALSGFLVVLHQLGFLGEKNTPEVQSPPVSRTIGEGTKPAGTSQAASTGAAIAVPAAASANPPKYSITFPSGAELKFRNHRAQGSYKLLSAQVERGSTGKLVFKFIIRLTNNGPSDVGFWNDSFRLLLDGVPLAPISYLNDAVEARSAKESEIKFEGADTATNVALRVLVGDKDEMSDIQITLKK